MEETWPQVWIVWLDSMDTHNKWGNTWYAYVILKARLTSRFLCFPIKEVLLIAVSVSRYKINNILAAMNNVCFIYKIYFLFLETNIEKYLS